MISEKGRTSAGEIVAATCSVSREGTTISTLQVFGNTILSVEVKNLIYRESHGSGREYYERGRKQLIEICEKVIR